MTGTPPRLAQTALALILKRRDQDTVAGDLLEEYRQRCADQGDGTVWYIKQVLTFAWRWAMPTALLVAIAGFARFLLDIFRSPGNFVSRSIVSTLIVATIYFVMATYSSWRSGRILSGPLLALCSTLLDLVLNGIATGVFLIFWHQPVILGNIQRSGGLEEHLTLALFPVLPVALVLGLGGGIIGSIASGRFNGGTGMKTALTAVCIFTLLATAYLMFSLVILRPPHANAEASFRFASVIAGQSLVTLAVVGRFLSERWRWAPLPGAIWIAFLGAWALQTTLSGFHFEGYVLVLGLALVIQGVLTLPVLLKRQPVRT